MTDTATLTKWVTEAEAALHRLLTGAGVVSVKSEVGETRYTQAEAGHLRAYIADLKRQLGQTDGRRRGVPVSFL